VKYSRSLVIITGNSGSPVQPMVDWISRNPTHNAVKPVGSDKVIGYRGEDLENAMAGGKSAVVAAYDPSSVSNLQDWCQREGINTFTVFVKAPQELSFSRAMGNAQLMKRGIPIDTLLPDIADMPEKDVLLAYENGELACIDKPHYQSTMTPDDFLSKFSSIIHSEPLWADSLEHDATVNYEPAYGPSIDDLTSQALNRHSKMAVESGYGEPEPDAAPGAQPKAQQPTPSNPSPRF